MSSMIQRRSSVLYFVRASQEFTAEPGPTTLNKKYEFTSKDSEREFTYAIIWVLATVDGRIYIWVVGVE